VKEQTVKEREIRPKIGWVGALHWDRRLFDSLIPLPDGTSYNAYLVRGSKKVALIDTVDPAKTEVLMRKLDSVPRVDYLIVQHVEQDHSGSVPAVIERYPEVRVLATPKARGMIVDHLGVPDDRITSVEDKETLSLGDRTLEFIHAPWVHWPETMFTYLREEKLLFSCDFLGSHIASTDLFASDRHRVYSAAKRYYAEIMMPFRGAIQGHLDRLSRYDISLVLPSHGPMHDDPPFILDAYRRWVLDPPKNTVVLPYVSMHGSTSRMVEHLVGALVDHGVSVEPFDMAGADLGSLAMALVEAATVVFATPTVLVGAHPHIVTAAYLVNALRPKLRFGAVVGSYGWGGKAAEQVTGLVGTLKLEWFDPVFARGLPQEETFSALDRLADAIRKKHEGL
jgi:flavorubredoxin